MYPPVGPSFSQGEGEYKHDHLENTIIAPVPKGAGRPT